MKILNLLEYDMPLKRGFYEDGEHETDDKISVDGFEVDLTCYQIRFTGNERNFRDSPPEADVYAADVSRIVINQIAYLPAKYEMYDLDLEIPSSEFTLEDIKNSLVNMFNEYLSDDEEHSPEYRQKVLPYLVKGSQAIAKKILDYIHSVEHSKL